MAAQRNAAHQEQHIEEKYLEFHKKKSQPTNGTNKEGSNIQLNVKYLMPKYEMSALCEEEESVIVSSISKSIRSSGHILMDDTTSNAARNYYQRIVNDQRTTYDQKKLKIYLDLVVGSKAALKTNRQKFRNHNEFVLNYKIGIHTENISSVNGCALTVGRYKETDICLGYKDLTISRIQCFILIIDNSLIILDGWSYFGTQTIQVNENKNNLQNSIPNQRFVLRFNKKDTIQLRFGETNTDLIINPKTCVICLDKSRTIRNKCGHLILCRDCYNNMLSNKYIQCPICRAPLQLNLLNRNKNINNNNNILNNSNVEEYDMINSYCKPSHLL